MSHHRFAVSVSKKVARAVGRNYMKRRMRENFRLHNRLLEQKHDLWVVIKERFDHSRSLEIEKIFVNALIEINYR
jgi:ribonuclease P protein component